MNVNDILVKVQEMIKHEELIIMRAIAICFKPFLKPEEALIYCNLSRTQFTKRCEDFGVFKTSGGYFKKEDLDLMMSGRSSQYDLNAATVINGNRRKHR